MTAKWQLEGEDTDYRFTLANERTFVAWIRTGLAKLALAMELHQFAGHLGFAAVISGIAIGLNSLSGLLFGHVYYRRVHVLLRREGHTDNVKRIYRFYREEGLSLRLALPRRNKAAKLRQPKQLAHTIKEIWNMDFVADALFDGRNPI